MSRLVRSAFDCCLAAASLRESRVGLCLGGTLVAQMQRVGIEASVDTRIAEKKASKKKRVEIQSPVS